jgi:hypothetical protein
MMTDTATAAIRASTREISAILLDATAMADWNPALLSVGGPPGPAEVGLLYPVVLRPGFHGHMVYRTVEAGRIDIDYRFPVLGLEQGTWRLESRGGSESATRVVHTFTHPGFVGKLTAGIFRGVAELRVARLAERAEGR